MNRNNNQQRSHHPLIDTFVIDNVSSRIKGRMNSRIVLSTVTSILLLIVVAWALVAIGVDIFNTDRGKFSLWIITNSLLATAMVFISMKESKDKQEKVDKHIDNKINHFISSLRPPLPPVSRRIR